MAYNKIYSIGNTINEAFINAKINEIGHKNSTTFLKKTRLKIINYKDPKKLEIYLIIIHNIDTLDREVSEYEDKIYNKMLDYFGYSKLQDLIKIYNEPSDISIGFRIGKYGKYNKYKFLF